MTSQKSYFNPKFASDSIKRSWPTTLLFTLLLFFAMPVALLISIQNVDMRYVDTVACIEFIILIARFLSFCMAFFAGVVCFRHMNNRVSAYYYHSLPISREAQYIHMLVNGFTSYAAAFFINTLLSQMILLTNYKLNASYSGMLWQGGLQNFLFFAIFFVITMLAGTLCGTSIVQLIISMIILYIAPLMQVSLVLLTTEYMRYISASDYLSLELSEKLSVGIRIFTSLADEAITLDVMENLLYLLFTVVIVIGGMMIFRFRKAERAGMPFIFPRFGSVVKYVIMVPVTILAGMFFGYLMTNGSFIWTVFGYICGALLTFMMVNAVSQKNARAMFRNFKGFVIYAGCAAAVILTLGLDLFSLNHFIPNLHNLTSVTMETDRLPMLTFTDEAGMDYICSLGKAVEIFDENNSEYYSADENHFEVDGTYFYVGTGHSDTIKVTFKQKFGPTIVKRYVVEEDTIAAIEDELMAVAESDAFADAYLANINSDLEELRSLDMWIDYFGSSSYSDYWNGMKSEEISRYYADLINTIQASRSGLGWQYFQSGEVGSISIYGLAGNNIYLSYRYPVYLGDQQLSSFVDSVVKTPSLSLPYDELFDQLYVINVETGKYMKLADESEYAAVLEAFAGDNISVFTQIDSKYRILYVKGVDPDVLYDQGYSDEEIAENIKEHGDFNYGSYYVLKDRLPAFVVNELG